MTVTSLQTWRDTAEGQQLLATSSVTVIDDVDAYVYSDVPGTTIVTLAPEPVAPAYASRPGAYARRRMRILFSE